MGNNVFGRCLRVIEEEFERWKKGRIRVMLTRKGV